jgi:hypothetical protein
MKKLFFLLVIVASQLSAGEINIDVDTPVFLKPDVLKAKMMFLQKPLRAEYQEKKKTRQQLGSLFRPLDFYRIDTPKGSIWIAPDVKIDKNGGKIKLAYVRNPLFKYLSGICALIFVLGLYFYISGLKGKTIKPKTYRYVLPALLVVLHFAILFYVIYLAREQLRYPLDEFAFFNVAKGMINWNFIPKWRMTVGMPLVYIPFILIFNAKDMFDIVLPVCIFFACVLMPASIVFVFFIARKLTSSPRCSFLAALLWLFLNMLYFPVEGGETKSVFSIFGSDLGEYISTCYLFIRTGFNSMSGNLAMFTLFAALLLALYMKPRFRMFAIVSAIYGFSCVTRINNVFFAPMIAWLFWCRNKDLLINWKYLLKAVVISISAFIAVFSLQLAANQLNFGSIFIFPYSLHPTEVYKGFEIGNLNRGINYYFRIHYFSFAATLAALMSMKKRNLKVALILWTMPLTIFFCGYCVLGQPIRFLLPVFSGLCVAIVCSGIRHGLKRQQKLLLIFTVIVLALPFLPFQFYSSNLYEVLRQTNFNHITKLYSLRLIVGPMLWLYMLYSLRKLRPAFIFILIYGILIFAGSPYILFFGCVVALIYAILIFIIETSCIFTGVVKQ